MQSRRGLVWLAVFLCALAAEGAYCFQHPIAYFDTMAYTSLLRDGRDGTDLRSVGAGCAAALPGAYSGCSVVTSSEVFDQAAHLDGQEYPIFLRFYRVKPLYLLLARILSAALRADPWWALRLVSAVSFVSIGTLILLLLRRLVAPGPATAGALCLMSLPGVIGLGRALLPDALLTALLLLAVVLLVRRAWWLGGTALLLATLVRQDALLFAATGAVVLLWGGPGTVRVRLIRLAVLAIALGVWSVGLHRLIGALPWRVLFVHSFLAWTPPVDYATLHVSLREYLHVLGSNGVRTVLFCLPLPGLLTLLTLAGRRSLLRDLVLAAAAAVSLRVLLYPGVEERYYVWLTLLAGAGALASLYDQTRLDSVRAG